jgi:hypothetical protein
MIDDMDDQPAILNNIASGFVLCLRQLDRVAVLRRSQ